MARARASLSLPEARRIAIAAQGLERARPKRVRADDLLRVVKRLGLLQLDFVKVLTPAHHHTLFSRLGPHEPALLWELADRRALTEQWAREASLVPIDAWPLLEHRRAARRAQPRGFDDLLADHPRYAAEVLAAVKERGPLAAADLPPPPGVARKFDRGWVTGPGTVPRAVLESLFARGELAIATRRPDMSRAYDLPERVIPAAQLGASIEREAAERELLLRAARAHGIATASDLGDAWRLRRSRVEPRLRELVESGALREVRVEGWREPAWLDPAARIPRAVEAAALLSPFDPLIACRARTERLFGVEYRHEVFVPRTLRRWGVWVEPFLLGERLVARLDLKADRAAGALRVLGAWTEPGASSKTVAGPVTGELRALAGWLGLPRVLVARRGDLAAALARSAQRSC